MSTIDNRVVAMDFDGSKFGSGVTNTLSMLDKLKAALHLPGAAKGLQDVSAAAGQFNSAPMEQGANRIAGSFTAMQAIAFGALASIGQKAFAIGSQIASSLTIDPIKQGFQEYETNMNSIQTILSNTKASGTGLTEVNAALDEMNHYSDQTIYNFSEMAKNVGTFTAAGVDLDTATGSIKGIANLAALSGSNSQQAAGAMYQLSQEIASGKVTLMGWNSVVNAGMGGTVFQRALAETAVAMGKIDKSTLTLEGDMKNVKIAGESFRDSISAEGGGESWLTSDVLTNTLQQFTGDLNEAELAAQGFTQEQIKAIQEQANMAVGAATEVKTLSGLMDTLKEGVASGWSQSFRIIIGDFEEAKTLFTGISNSVGGFFGRISDSRNEMLQGWKDMGGRDILIGGLTDAFWLLAAPLAQVGMAFRDVFPKSSVTDLVALTQQFADFVAELRPSHETLDRLRRTLAGVFAILGIGWEVLKAVVGFLGKLLLGVTEGDQGILRFTASIGDFLVGLHQAIKNGEGLTSFFDKLLGVIFKIINPIRDAGQAFGQFFEGLGGGNLGKIGESLGEFLTGLLTFGDSIDKASDAGGKFSAVLGSIFSFFGNIGSALATFFKPLADGINNALKGINFDQVMEALQTGSLVGIALFLKQIGGMFKGFSLFQNDNGFFDKIKEGLDGVTGTLSAMQANLKASMLLKIAGAIALLAISVVLLAGVDGPGLLRATAALTVMFIQLGAAMMAFQSIGSIASIAKLNLMGTALILIGVAILILAGAVKILASMSWEELAKGLGALTVLIAGIIAMSRGIDKSRGAILRGAAALVIMGLAIGALVVSVKILGNMDLVSLAKGLGGVALLLVGLALFSKIQAASGPSVVQAFKLLMLAFAIKTLAESVVIFATMSWEELARGFAGLAGGLIAVGLALRFMPDGVKLIFAALGIGKVAAATMLIAKAMKMYATIEWETIAKGLGSLGGSMAILVLAMRAMPKVGLAQTVGLLIVAYAVSVVADAVKLLGSLDIATALQGVIAVGVIMGILVVAMNLMSGTLAGAAAILIVAAALNILVPVIQTMGEMPILALVVGLTALAAVFVILGVAGYLLTPVVPTLMALGIAIALIGAATALAGLGVFLFATGLTALGVAGAAATAGIVAIVSGLIGLIPLVIYQIGLGLVAFAQVIATAGPAIQGAMVAVMLAFLQAIIDVTPKVVETLLVLLFNFLHTLEQAVPRIIATGFSLIMALLRGIRDNIGRIVGVVADIIVNFINALALQIPKLVQAGIDWVIALVEGLADGIRKNSERMGEAGAELATAIIEGMIKGIAAGAGRVVSKVKGLAGSALGAAADFLGINSPSREFAKIGMGIDEGMAKGIGDYTHLVTKATTRMGSDTLSAMGKTINGLGALIDSEMGDNLSPVITPVLDLSSIQRDASNIGSLLGGNPLDVGASYSAAARASDGYRSNQAAANEQQGESAGTNVSLTQNNYSPKALSAIDIYRNTNNQLSVAKGALKRTGASTR